MTLRQLEIFFAIVKTGRFTAAAKSLYVAQPSVSQQIHALEAARPANVHEIETHPFRR